MLTLPESVESIERLRPGAKGLIVRDGKILVVKEKVLRGGEEVVIYDFPGGGIEPGETLEEGLYREIYEEVGLQVEAKRVVGAWDFVVVNTQDITKGVQIICIGYECSLVGTDDIDVTQNPAEEDIFEAVWLTPAEIRQVPGETLTHPGMLTALQVLENSWEA